MREAQAVEARRLLTSDYDKKLVIPDLRTAKCIKRAIRLEKKKEWLTGKKKLRNRVQRASLVYFRYLTKRRHGQQPNSRLTRKEIEEAIFVRELKAKYFRWVNERLYSISGRQGLRLFAGDSDRKLSRRERKNKGLQSSTLSKRTHGSPSALFQGYLEGYAAQVSTWPVNPVDEALGFFRRFPSSWTIADFGAGDGRFSLETTQKRVYNVDLYARDGLNVTICSMAQTPFKTETFDAVVMCLSLMGTDYPLFLREAWRVLKKEGILWMAEVRSRFESSDGKHIVLKKFKQCMRRIGFRVTYEDRPSKMFFVMVFQKINPSKSKHTNSHKGKDETKSRSKAASTATPDAEQMKKKKKKKKNRETQSLQRPKSELSDREMDTFKSKRDDVISDTEDSDEEPGTWKPAKLKRSGWPRLKVCAFRKREPRHHLLAARALENR